MPRITTTSFKVSAAKSLLSDIANTSSAYYVTVGQPQGWGANAPSVPDDSPSGGSYDVFDAMVGGKRVASADVKMMVPRFDWTANTIYSMYDDQDGALHTKSFFVHVNAGSTHYVFKCLDNISNTASNVQPDFSQTSASDAFYKTSDGYRWKYMYQVDSTTWSKFATTDWMPVVEDTAVTSNAVAGSIDVIVVANGGSQYNNYTSGSFKALQTDLSGALTVCVLDPSASANSNFYTGCAIKITSGAGAGQQRTITQYTTVSGDRVATIDSAWDSTNLPNTSSHYEVSPLVTIQGDGTGTIARAVINATSNTVSSVEITARGKNYTYANATVSGNTGTSTTNNASLRAIISPKYGHGGDVNDELGATAVGIGSSISDESGTLANNGVFATTTLLKDPLWASATLALTGITGFFQVGESVVPTSNTSYHGTVASFNSGTSQLVLQNVSGGFAAGAAIKGLTSNATATISTTTIGGQAKAFDTFDQRYRFGVTYNGGGPFNTNDSVATPNANAVVQYANTSFVATVSKHGTVNVGDQLVSNTASANVTSIASPDVVPTSGKVLYVETTTPVVRGTNSFKFIIGF